MSSQKISLGLFLGWLLLAAVSYNVLSTGINDRFYFDDYSNLVQLGDNGGVTSWESLKAYLKSNPSGPTGRPVSVASFLINDNDWPSSASGFKKTNVLVHLLVGLILFWVLLVFLKDYKLLHQKGWPVWVPIFVAGFWLLNPLHISTILYPVQRMAQLSALFGLLGVLVYIKIRPRVAVRPVVWLPVLVVLTAIFFVLSVYSKENGVLLPIYLFIIEVFIYKKIYPLGKSLKITSNVIFCFSILGIFGFIVYKVGVNGWLEVYPGRDFSPYQRLISQPAIIFDYIKELFFPSLYTAGLYYDHVKHFESIFSLDAILPSVAMVTLLIAAFILFKKGCLSAFAVLFFFSAHLLESTVLNLELAFEHRNYMASLFLGFVVVDLLRWIKGRFFKNALMVSVLVMLFLVSTQRASLWSDELLFAAVIAEKSPDSVRSQIELNNALVEHGRLQDAILQIKTAIESNPSDMYLALHAVLLDCIGGVRSKENSNRLLELAATQSFDGRNRLAIDKIYQYSVNNECSQLNPEFFNNLLEAFREGEKVGRNEGEISRRGLRILEQKFYLQFPEFAPSSIKPVAEILNSRNPEYLMLSAASLASTGRYQEALLLSNRALTLVKQGVMGSSSRSQKTFSREIESFNRTVEGDLRRYD